MMKKQYFLNAKIIDPKNSMDEIGGLIIGENGKIEAIGKTVNQNNIPSREKYIDLKEKFIFFLFFLNSASLRFCASLPIFSIASIVIYCPLFSY